jgi:hypothetical protein
MKLAALLCLVLALTAPGLAQDLGFEGVERTGRARTADLSPLDLRSTLETPWAFLKSFGRNYPIFAGMVGAVVALGESAPVWKVLPAGAVIGAGLHAGLQWAIHGRVDWWRLTGSAIGGLVGGMTGTGFVGIIGGAMAGEAVAGWLQRTWSSGEK